MTTAIGTTLGTALAVGTDTGRGPALVLLHGFPHTHRVWDRVGPDLAATHRVATVDLVRGGSALELADRLERLLDELSLDTATLVAIDAGVPSAVALALSRPARVDALVVMEAVLPGVPGAEEFLRTPPWWFGFHQVPGLAETVVEGHERAYVEWFLRLGTADGQGVGSDLTDAMASGYTGRAALAGAFEHYRAMPRSAAELADLLADHRLTMPVLAIGARPVGPVLARQLGPVTDQLRSVQLDDCGHVVPLDAPGALLETWAAWSRSFRR